jgi:hypothetical protein
LDGERSIDDLVVVDREPDVPGRAERDLGGDAAAGIPPVSRSGMDALPTIGDA